MMDTYPVLSLSGKSFFPLLREEGEREGGSGGKKRAGEKGLGNGKGDSLGGMKEKCKKKD